MRTRYICFFFSSRRRHTRYWRDWSSDVCSSDLGPMRREPSLTFRGALRILGKTETPLIDKLDTLLGGAILASGVGAVAGARSEERRVGKECRSRRSPSH